MKKVITTIALAVSFASMLAAQTPKKATPDTQTSIAKGAVVYSKHCMACHQADGGGVTGLNPPLSKTEYVLGDKNRLINIILKGLNQELEIDGEIYSNPMPPLNFLTDQQIADVLTYVRNNFQNKASAVAAKEVTAIRQKNK